MILHLAKEKVESRLKKENLFQKKILIKAKVLSAQEAIGNPERDDFPLLKGRERIVEANYEGHLGHAFTDMHGGFEGQISELFQMPLDNNYRRALLVGAINALSHYWGMVDDTVHCKDTQPEECARKCVEFIKQGYPNIKRITFVGYQPALVENFSKDFSLKILDLDAQNVGQKKYGVTVLDGEKDMKESISWAEIVLATGSTVVNGTIDRILSFAKPEKKVIFYGVTIAGVAKWIDLKRMCFLK